VAAALAGTVLSAGCAQKIERLRQEACAPDEVTTASVTAVRAAAREIAAPRRPYAEVKVQTEDGTVTHAPLYFEDPYEDVESEEYCVVWSPGDYLHSWLYGPGRCLVNTIFFPVSVAVDPPWARMASDGYPSRTVAWWKHDARR